VIQVLMLRKIFSTKPQQFMLVLKDPVNLQNTQFGAEREVRAILKTIGTPQPEIDELFHSANSVGKSPLQT
jgi:hypothetical protein